MIPASQSTNIHGRKEDSTVVHLEMTKTKTQTKTRTRTRTRARTRTRTRTRTRVQTSVSSCPACNRTGCPAQGAQETGARRTGSCEGFLPLISISKGNRWVIILTLSQFFYHEVKWTNWICLLQWGRIFGRESLHWMPIWFPFTCITVLQISHVTQVNTCHMYQRLTYIPNLSKLRQ